ncbi:MAG: penicillin-binding protein, partial [Spirochaetaceae bacterium]|nr:penicillin-binding protein [Spirochaetaceae bacterium]
LANDKAPYFSEYIRTRIEQYLFGQQDIYRDGYTIHTTLNLDFQREADKEVAQGLIKWNLAYREDRDTKTEYASSDLVQVIDLISLVFDIPEIRVAGAQEKRRAEEYFEYNLAPVMDMMAMTFGLTELKTLTNITYKKTLTHTQMNNVETALITLGNDNGYILAMIGGSEFNRNNQFNRAMDAKVMPGSAFKPLYYSAAISSGAVTPATRIYDSPRVFISPDGTPYIPGNYAGRWSGYVLVRDALARSLNIPALTVLEKIGFDAAISRSAGLLGITDPQEIGETFDRVYPLGLGTLSIAPIRLARAYATMANRGRAVEPLAIRYIEDRDGNIIVNPEMELRESQEKRNIQIMSPQSAYIMTSMLQTTVARGTLAYARRTVDGFDGMPVAGKTGTTQNWTDAWTMGFSPYYTTALWIGFDKRGNSLGRYQTGATSTGPVWARYMKTIHEDLPRIDFPRPETGIVEVEIDKRTGMLPSEDTPEDQLRNEIFIAGTQPKTQSDMSQFEKNRDEDQIIKISVDSSLTNLNDDGSSNAVFTRDLFSELGLEPLYLDGRNTPDRNNGTTGGTGNTSSILD